MSTLLSMIQCGLFFATWYSCFFPVPSFFIKQMKTDEDASGAIALATLSYNRAKVLALLSIAVAIMRFHYK